MSWSPRHAGPAALILVLLLPLLGGRADSHPRPPDAELRAARARARALPSVRAEIAPHAVAEPEASDSRCEDLIERVRSEPASAGTPSLDAARGTVLLYAKAEPVVFSRTPAVASGGSDAAGTYRTMLRETSSPWSMISKLWPVFSANPELGRSVLLREGYLYAEKPELAFALVDLVAAQLLYSDKEIWIQRGERLLRAERAKSGHYVFSDGPERGERVRLLLFDRVGVGTPPEPIHRDFRALREVLGFDRVKIVHQTDGAIVAELRYGTVWVQTLLRAEGAHLSRSCEVLSAATAPVVAGQRAEHLRRKRVLEPLRRAMAFGIEDGLPFDEPVTEYGQQDGRLRRLWLQAYLGRQSDYEFQGDKYYVYNAAGRPLVPEVCVDYIFDTFERSSGTWWRSRGEPRDRIVGKVDFATLSDETMRRATSFIDYASKLPGSFDVVTLPEEQRVPFKFPKRLSDYLIQEADHYLPGDVVLIRGYAPWDKPWKPKIQHTHSFFVYETDPVSGMPILLAGNPGRPLLQTWQFEAFRTPDRSIWTRVRPHLGWLESVVAEDLPGEPFPSPVPLSIDRKDRPPERSPSGTDPGVGSRAG
jgi:hypothetical protein